MSTDYKFTQDWFPSNVWDMNLRKVKDVYRYLEIGSFEGRSMCHLIETFGNLHDLEVVAIDTWEGGEDHFDHEEASAKRGENFKYNWEEVKANYKHNVKKACDSVEHNVTVRNHEGDSRKLLPELLASGLKGYFDLIYIDGSHQVEDVLFDAVMSYELLAEFGTIVFDDYLFDYGSSNPLHSPKMAIDSFTNCYWDNLFIMPGLNGQTWVHKMSSGVTAVP